MKKILTVLVMLFSINFVYGESCTSTGTTQKKYTASGCSYTTQKRECCSNGWTPWVADSETLHCCSANHCWNGSSCQTPAPTSQTVSAPSGYYHVTTCTYLKYPTECIYGQGFEYQEEGSLAGCSCASGYSNFSKDAKRCYKCGWSDAGYDEGTGACRAYSEVCNGTYPDYQWTGSGDPTFAQWQAHGPYMNTISCSRASCGNGKYRAKVTRRYFTCS